MANGVNGALNIVESRAARSAWHEMQWRMVRRGDGRVDASRMELADSGFADPFQS